MSIRGDLGAEIPEGTREASGMVGLGVEMSFQATLLALYWLLATTHGLVLA